MTAPTFPAALVEALAQRQHEMRRDRYPLSVTLPWGDISDDDKEAVRECVRGVLSALPAAVQAVARGEAVAVPRNMLQRIECTMLHGDYRNGVTDNTGSIDEGDVRAGEVIDEVRLLLAASAFAQEPQR